MEQNKDQIGAAVRGEAVALTDTEIMEALSEVQFPKPVRLPAGWVYFARAIEKKIAAKVSARAADALDSQPTGDGKLLCAMEFEAVELGYAGLAEAMAVLRRMKADPDADREALIACLGDDAATLSHINPDDEMAQTMRDAIAMLESDEVIIATLGMASSQPTDGGVRNGRDLKAVHAFLMGESPLEGVQFGDKHPTKAGAFWWRLNLRAALAKG